MLGSFLYLPRDQVLPIVYAMFMGGLGEFCDWQNACGFIVSEFGGFENILCDAGVSCKCD